jgi:hypothetical protein
MVWAVSDNCCSGCRKMQLHLPCRSFPSLRQRSAAVKPNRRHHLTRACDRLETPTSLSNFQSPTVSQHHDNLQPSNIFVFYPQ